MRKLKLAWKYKRFLWKYRRLLRHRKTILRAAVAGAAIGAAAIVVRVSISKA